MACILKAPSQDAKGCIVFTTPERDNVIFKSDDVRLAIEKLKARYVVGLHHNWHDYQFHYNHLFDFSLAGDGDLIEVNNTPFKRIGIDACNFSPETFLEQRSEKPFWDILYVARAVAFKGLPEFFAAIRKLYDTGHMYRVLFVCSMPETLELDGIPDLRKHFEAMFSPAERKFFNFLTLDWDYPFPFDLETLSFFYRNSRVFLHPAPEERRCRVAAYAWANRMPVVANVHVASILPKKFHRPPFLYEFTEPEGIAEAVKRALEAPSQAESESDNVADEFSALPASVRLDAQLREITRSGQPLTLASRPINHKGLDIRLGRHHQLAVGGNRLNYGIDDLCRYLEAIPDEALEDIIATADPEVTLGEWGAERHPASDVLKESMQHAAGATQKVGMRQTSLRAFIKKNKALFSRLVGKV